MTRSNRNSTTEAIAAGRAEGVGRPVSRGLSDSRLTGSDARAATGAMRHAALAWVAVERLVPYARNARTHSRAQVRQIADSIARFGFVNPVLVSAAGEIIAGHGRVAAAKLLGLAEVPVLELAHLSEAERRAYVLADNRLAEAAGWDRGLLAVELQALIDVDFEVELTGFALAEIDGILDAARAADPSAAGPEGADDVPDLSAGPAVTQPGDVWRLGGHALLCGDARDADGARRLLGAEAVDMVFTDPPYNVPIEGHVSGLGRARHREFAFASGEMTAEAFTSFLADALAPAAALSREGAIAFVCMDWRHMREMLAAGDRVFAELKNLCVWNKTNGGMGTFYRSKHELVFVWKVRPGPHVNSFGLGETGRYRTNVWDHAGVNAFGAERDAALAMHPTVKPVALIAEAIRDCSRRRDIVFDPFGGSGSTMIAAEITGRRARLVEIDPLYCDTILARWSRFTGKAPVLAATGQSFEEVVAARGSGGVAQGSDADMPGTGGPGAAADMAPGGPVENAPSPVPAARTRRRGRTAGVSLSGAASGKHQREDAE